MIRKSPSRCQRETAVGEAHNPWNSLTFRPKRLTLAARFGEYRRGIYHTVDNRVEFTRPWRFLPICGSWGDISPWPRWDWKWQPPSCWAPFWTIIWSGRLGEWWWAPC